MVLNYFDEKQTANNRSVSASPPNVGSAYKILELNGNMIESEVFQPNSKNLLRILVETIGIWYFKWKFSLLDTRSDKWKKLQDWINNKPSVGLYREVRRLFYQKSFAKSGENLELYPNLIISNPKNIEIGSNIKINRGVFITAPGKIKIGNYVLIGPYTVINSGNHSYSDPDVPIRSQGHVIKPIVIEDDVWIGANSTILAGVTIGRGAVVGAGAVVTKNVDPYTVVGGVPAAFIKERKKYIVGNELKKL